MKPGERGSDMADEPEVFLQPEGKISAERRRRGGCGGSVAYFRGLE